MKIEIKNTCPLNNFKPCKKFDCGWFIQVRGTNPQTGEPQDEFACAITMLPLLMVENSMQARQTGAAIESFRNEMVKANQTTVTALLNNTENKKLKKG